LEGTLRELNTQLAAVEAGTNGGSTEIKVTTVKLAKFDGATSWAVFRRHFETAEFQNNWTENEKTAQFYSVLQCQAADILHAVPTEATFGDIFRAFRDRFGEQQLATAYRSQLKARVHKIGETLQDFAAGVEKLAQRALANLPFAFFKLDPSMHSSTE
jgi:hypothetical protein